MTLRVWLTPAKTAATNREPSQDKNLAPECCNPKADGKMRRVAVNGS